MDDWDNIMTYIPPSLPRIPYGGSNPFHDRHPSVQEHITEQIFPKHTKPEVTVGNGRTGLAR